MSAGALALAALYCAVLYPHPGMGLDILDQVTLVYFTFASHSVLSKIKQIMCRSGHATEHVRMQVTIKPGIPWFGLLL